MKLAKFVLLVIIILSVLVCCEIRTTEPGQNRLAKPTFSPPGRAYTSAQIVTISSPSTIGAAIFYTTDGSDPSSGSAVYSGPIRISTTTTIKALAVRPGWIDSAISTATYTISSGQMIYVPGGTFTMGDTRGEGDDNELPTRTVTLNSFYIGKYEVTQSEWSAVMRYIPASFTGRGANYPVDYVSWYAVLKYCNLRSISEGFTPVYSIYGSTNPADWGPEPDFNHAAWDAVVCNWNANGYRLPTEAEWEYAARGATNNPDYLYSGSDDINAVAWYSGNNDTDGGFSSGARQVGLKAPNGLGLHDMSGNVWEWCWDRYAVGYYSASPVNNPTGPTSGGGRILRGGNWLSSANYCRVTARHGSSPHPDYFFDTAGGFRLSRTKIHM